LADFSTAWADDLLVSSSEVKRGATEDVVRIAVASGEGRSARHMQIPRRQAVRRTALS